MGRRKICVFRGEYGILIAKKKPIRLLFWEQMDPVKPLLPEILIFACFILTILACYALQSKHSRVFSLGFFAEYI